MIEKRTDQMPLNLLSPSLLPLRFGSQPNRSPYYRDLLDHPAGPKKKKNRLHHKNKQ
jgi:hypothetical protein